MNVLRLGALFIATACSGGGGGAAPAPAPSAPASEKRAPAAVPPAPVPEPGPAAPGTQPQTAAASVERASCRGDLADECDVRMPERGVDRAKRIVEGDGGYLDLFRAKDGSTLWARRGWDDGSSQHWRFALAANRSGWSDAVLQFVDGVTEPREHPDKTSWNEETGSSESGPHRLLAEAWLVSAHARMAMRPTASAPVPLVHAGRGPGDPRPLQWMVHFARCPELGGPCVYFGAPKAVARRIDTAESARGKDSVPLDLWIYPADR
jgi:hypothetical protein